MRSAFSVLAAVLLSACAVGVGGEGETAQHDSGTKPHTGSNDAASQPDDGTQAPTFDDAGTTNNNNNNNTVDSGTTNTGCAFTGVLATFDFTGEPGNQTSTNATTTASGVTATAFTRSSGVTATSGLDSINSSNWPTATSIDKTRYYTFTIKPSGSCALDLTSISVGSKSSSTGPANAAVATSADQFAATTTFAPGATGSEKLSVSGATGAVEVRVYGYGASSTSGTFRVGTTLTISGSLN